jgi:hypothetical protein
MGNTEIKLSFTLDEVNRILGALGERPFVQVTDLITKIQRQALPQVPNQTEAAVQTPAMVADELV